MFDYESLKKTASKLIANFGADAVVSREDGTGYNPSSGSLYSGISVTFTAKAVRAQFTISEKDKFLMKRKLFLLFNLYNP